MKYLRLTVRPPAELAPRAFEMLAMSAHVDRARALAMNISVTPGATALFHVEGDDAALREGFADAPEVRHAEFVPAPTDGFYLLLSLDVGEVPLLAPFFETVARERLVVLPPAVYGDGGVHVRLVGTTTTISRIVEVLPDAVDLEVHEVGERGLAAGSITASLSDRQREAVRAALELGYYDQPRGTTHGDVSEVLGCAPSTASEHLRKAEAKLVRAAFATERG